MANDSLDQLRRLVIDDAGLRERLLAVTGREAFVSAVTEVARERGIDLPSGAVVAALDHARRERRAQWV